MPVAPNISPGTLVPTATPQVDATPSVNVNAPLDVAFGSTVGRSLEGLGQTMDQAGDRIWARAIDLQNLQNETNARNADSDYMKKAALIQADFDARKGVDAGPEALKAHIEKLQQTRQDVRDTLGNPAAQRMYDSSSLGFMGRNIYASARYSADQVKYAAIEGIDKRIPTLAGIAATSDDPHQREWAEGRIAALNQRRWALAGVPDAAKDAEFQINSSLYEQRAIYMAKSNQDGAQEYLNSKKGQMEGNAFLRAQSAIDVQRRAVGSVNIANDVVKNAGVDENGMPKKSLKEMQDEVRDKAKELYPDDSVMQVHAAAALEARWNQMVRAQQTERWNNNQIVDGAIATGKVKNQQDLMAHPETANAVNHLPKQDQLALPGRINNANFQRNRVENTENFTQLMGLSYAQSDDDRAKFMDTDINSIQMSDQQRLQIIKRRDQILKSDQDDVRVWRAMSWLRGSNGGQLQAAGLYKRDAKNPEDFDRFVGSLHAALEDWQQATGKPASQQDVIDKIAPTLLQTHAIPGTLWGTNQIGNFNDPPDAFVKATQNAYINKGHPAPTDAQMRTEWVHFLLSKYYKPKSGADDGK